MKTVRQLMKGILCALLCAGAILPAAAEGEPLHCAFTWTGMWNAGEPLAQVYPYEESDSAYVTAWKSETVYLKAAITADSDMHVSVQTGELTGQDETDVLTVTAGFLAETSASLGMGTDAWTPHVNRADIITEATETDLISGETAYLWITIPVREDAAGSYRGTIQVEGNVSCTLHLEVAVSPYSLQEESLSLDLWQYPFSSYYRYESLRGEELFSPAHLDILRQELAVYRALGGSHVTCAITEEPWAHQTWYDTPSLVKWNLDGNGFLWFDYSWFDAWVSLCREAGISGPIDCFSILPFDQAITVYDDMGNPMRMVLTPTDETWRWYWENFLYSFTAHLEEKGWLDDAFLFVDERGIDYFAPMMDYVRSLDCGSRLHFAAALNVIPRDTGLYDRFDYLSISIASVPENDAEFDAFLSHRRELGLTTTMYNCSTNYPNAFAISDPCESVWSMQYLAMRGFDGYLRWAYNAWPEDPLTVMDNPHFEAGDTFLIYPDRMDAQNPKPMRSVRLCMMEQGWNDAKKYRYLLAHADPDTAELLRSGFASMRRCYGTYNAYGAMGAVNDTNRSILAAETVRLETLMQKAVLYAAWKEKGIELQALRAELEALSQPAYQ